MIIRKEGIMKEIKEFLLKNHDEKYLDFSSGLGTYSNKRRLGVRIPLLRDYAKSLSKKYSLDYLINNIDEEYYEEIMLKGFIIGNYKLTYGELINYIEYFLPKISDWSICDTFVASLKMSKRYSNKLWDYIINKLNSKNEFDVRFSLVMILNYYINDDYKNKVFEVIKSVSLDKYYVKMANAWLLSYMFINYFDDTVNFISKNKLDDFVLRKGITKAIESFRVSDEEKRVLRKIRERI